VNEDRATRYQRLKRRVGMTSLAWSVLLLAALLGSGASRYIRQSAEQLAANFGGGAAVVVVLYVVGLTMIHEAGSLPFSFYGGFLLERRYGLSTERLPAWLRDQVKSFAVSLVFAAGAATVVYFFIRRSPGGWWLPAGVVFALIIVGLTRLAPVMLLPLFYRIKPIDRDVLRTRLLALADRAGARVLGAYEWGLGDKTKKANAALAGLGNTRRILVSDTMLAEYSDEEIEIVLAHELAHHVHGDIWKGIALESVLVLAGFYCAARTLEAAVGWFGVEAAWDPAGVPLLLLAAGAVSLVMMPAAHALSRMLERSADHYALELTRNPGAFISAMRRLAAQNLAEEHPSRAIQWLFYSHPPVAERIAAAQAFKSYEAVERTS
jgi:STE24 endopeptidase